MAGDRFAVSALSRTKKLEALPEEILIHKGTGEVLIITPDGNMISFDKLSRYKAHINAVTFSSDNLNIKGDLFSLELDGIEFPDFITESTNLVPANVMLKNNSLSKLLVSIDLDCVEVDGIVTSTTQNEPTIKMDFLFKKAGQTDNTFSTTNPLSKSNTLVMSVNTLVAGVTDLNTYEVYLTGITVTRNPSNASKTLKNIIHSILITLE